MSLKDRTERYDSESSKYKEDNMKSKEVIIDKIETLKMRKIDQDNKDTLNGAVRAAEYQSQIETLQWVLE